MLRLCKKIQLNIAQLQKSSTSTTSKTREVHQQMNTPFSMEFPTIYIESLTAKLSSTFTIHAPAVPLRLHHHQYLTVTIQHVASKRHAMPITNPDSQYPFMISSYSKSPCSSSHVQL